MALHPISSGSVERFQNGQVSSRERQEIEAAGFIDCKSSAMFTANDSAVIVSATFIEVARRPRSVTLAVNWSFNELSNDRQLLLSSNREIHISRCSIKDKCLHKTSDIFCFAILDDFINTEVNYILRLEIIKD